jgi:hypothetical protein|nr:MAG TPA: hypothetical protein [Bacteriophage sp.]
MSKSEFLQDQFFQSQPERITYYNLGSTCAMCLTPRVAYNDATGVRDVWASNETVSNEVGRIFYEQKMRNPLFSCNEVNIYPLIYMVNREERTSMRGIEELENKYFLSAAIIEYPVYRYTYKQPYDELKDKPIPELRKLATGEYRTNYTAVIEQSLDGYIVPPKELVAMLINTAINYNRGIKWVPHKDIRINLCMPKSLIAEIEDHLKDGEVNPYGTPTGVMEFLAAEFGEDSIKDLENKFSKSNLVIKEIDDSTDSRMVKNLPLVYREVMDSFSTSFRSNPIS